MNSLTEGIVTQLENQKCQQTYTPSWKIEQKYSPGVLMYNWAEERHKYEHPDYFKSFPLSTMKQDYRRPCNHKVETDNRRIAAVFHQRGAVPNNLFFRHHGKRWDCSNVTWYDEVFNGRRFTDDEGCQKFPDVRHWAVADDAWKPEHSDYPLQGEGTKWGLVAKKEQYWDRLRRDEDRPFESVYHQSYNTPHAIPHCGLALTRYATPRELSFKMAETDRINWDTDYARCKQPERLWHFDKSSGLCEPRHPPKPLFN